MKRGISILLAVAMLLIPGCGKKQEATKQTYKMTVVQDFSLPLKTVLNSCLLNDRLWVLGYEKKNTNLLYSCGSDGSDLTKHEIPLEKPTFLGCDGKSLYLLGKDSFCRMDENCQTDLTVSFGELMDEADQDIFTLNADKDGNIYLCGEKSLLVFDKNGSKLAETVPDMEYFSICRTKDGRVLLYDWYKLYNIAVKDGKISFKELCDFSEYPRNGGFGSYDIYYSNYVSGLYGVDLSTGETTCMFTWADLGKNRNVTEYLEFSDGTVAACWSDSDARESGVKVLKRSDKPLTELTMYSVNQNRFISEAIYNFNRSQDKYYVNCIVLGYSEMNIALATGKMPDLFQTNLGSMDSYISKGLMVNLYTLMDQDQEFDRSQVTPCVLGAMERDGKLYELSPQFRFFAMLGCADVLGSDPGWSFDQAMEVFDSMGPGSDFMSGMDALTMLDTMMQIGLDSFIDYGTGQCHFDSDQFKKLLEVCKTGTRNITEGKMKDLMESGQVLGRFVGVNTFNDFREYLNEVQGMNVVYKGLPTATGNGLCIDPSWSYGICSKSPHQDGAWEFIKSLLDPEFQATMEFFPSLNSEFERQYKASIKKNPDEKEPEPVEIDPAAVASGSYDPEEYQRYLDYQAYIKANGRLTQEEADLAREAVLAADGRIGSMVTDPRRSIVTEEAQYYFAGEKTLEATVEVIQNRVQTYVNEFIS